jgi:Flp pilus assembly protein TadD
MARLVRCIEGHHYDPDVHKDCPHCAPTVAAAPSVAPTFRPATTGLAPSHGSTPLWIAGAGGAVALLALLWLVFGASPHGAGPPKHEETAKEEGVVERKEASVKEDSSGTQQAGPESADPSPPKSNTDGKPDLWKECRGDGKAADIDGCTAIINAGTESPGRLAVAYYNRGYAAHRLNDSDRAMADYKAAIDADPKYTDPKQKLALLAVSKGENALALPLFDELVKLKPDDAQLHYDRAAALIGLEEYDRAIAAYDEAIRLKPNFSLAYNNRAYARFKQRSYEEALVDVDKAIEIDASNAYAYDTRGHIYEAMGRREDAIKDLKRALEIQPQLKESQEALDRLGESR